MNISQTRNSVIIGTYRISFLTPRIVRFEFDKDSVFEDRPTLSVFQRPGVEEDTLSYEENNGAVVISNGMIEVKFTPTPEGFSRNNLLVFSIIHPETRWHPGLEDTENCLGTARTLDHTDGEAVFCRLTEKPLEKLKLNMGLISRSGWSVFDDSRSIVLGDEAGELWPEKRNKGHTQDIYLCIIGVRV